MTESKGFALLLAELNAKGILATLGRSAFQLVLIIGCVVLIYHIVKKMGNKTKGPGITVGWSVDEAQEREKLGLEETEKNEEK